MERLIPLISEFQSILARSNYSGKIQLPQIVVIGNQSSGKSTLLESIIGQEFLPKGTGIVTRRPTIIQLFHQSEEKPMHAEFVHKKGEIFTDFDKVRLEIENDTKRVAGANKGISSLPIVCKIYSNKLINLSLIDLPGLAKVPIGEQPPDIEEKILEMVRFYIKNPNCLILCVLPANVDLATSDALKLARTIDPQGARTIGVITKLDLMEKGTSSIDILEGRVYPLKLGFHGVVCRGQQGLKSGQSIKDSKIAELKFLNEHPDYSKISDRLGIDYLVHCLNTHLTHRIKKFLPGIRSKIYTMLQKAEAELRNLGNDPILGVTIESKKGTLLTVITKYSRIFYDMVNGRNCISNDGELLGGARINYIFNEVFRKKISNCSAFNNISDRDIRVAIRNANGLNPSLLVSEAAFEILVKDQIKNLLGPSLECAQLVYEELKRMIYNLNVPELIRFDNLSCSINTILEKMLSSLMIPTCLMINHIFEVELGHINTRHPDFILGAKDSLSGRNKEEKEEKTKRRGSGHDKDKKITQLENTVDHEKFSQDLSNSAYDYDVSVDGKVIQRDRGIIHDGSLFSKSTRVLTYLDRIPDRLIIESKPSKRELNEIELIKRMISSYFSVVKKNINDIIPKTIITFLVKKSITITEKELVENLYDDVKLDELMKENENIAKARRELKGNIEGLRDCINIVNKFEQSY